MIPVSHGGQEVVVCVSEWRPRTEFLSDGRQRGRDDGRVESLQAEGQAEAEHDFDAVYAPPALVGFLLGRDCFPGLGLLDGLGVRQRGSSYGLSIFFLGLVSSLPGLALAILPPCKFEACIHLEGFFLGGGGWGGLSIANEEE